MLARSWQPAPAAMEYSQRSGCLVALYEDGDIDQAPAAYSTELLVLDLSAGGRPLRRLGASSCALPSSARCIAAGCVTVSHSRSLHRAGVTARLGRSRCRSEAPATRW